MESAKFELTIKKYFEKAGVVLLKKGTDFSGSDEASSFLLLDTKRKSFYLTETDIPDDTDFEINATAEHLIAADMPQNVKAAILRLGRADARSELLTPNLYSLDGLVRKSALIISEQHVPQVTAFLTANGVVFQSVPFKGAFMVYFLDLANAEKLVEVYTAASQALHEQGHEDKAVDAEEVLSAISEPQVEDVILSEPKEVTAAFSFDSLIADVAPSGSKKVESSVSSSSESLLDESDTSDTSDTDVDKLLADIDLSMLIAPRAEDTPEEQEDAGLMYAKILNEQIDEHEVLLKAPRERNISEIPHDMIVDDITVDERASARIDEDTRSEQVQLLRKDTFEPKSKQKQAESHGKGRIVHKIAANVAGFIFFAPAYLVGKLTSRFFPPFIIYWLAAIAIIFGAYQYIWMVPGTMLYNALLDSADVLQVNLLLEIPAQGAVAEMAGSLIAFSSIMFLGLVKAADGLASGWLLRYFAAFGAVLMIFPYGRAFGARIIVFALFLYFTAPLIIMAQVFAINSATTMIASQHGSLSEGAAAIFASVFVIPIAALVILFIIAGWILPFGAKCENEVLP